MTIEALLPADWPAVLAIYEEGIDIGTFEELVPTWEEWDQGHLVWPRGELDLHRAQRPRSR